MRKEITYNMATKITCIKCGRKLDEREFYNYKQKEKYPICKDCLTMYVDNRKPDTFLWILEKFDVPYVEKKWVELTNREYLKNPARFNSKSVLGLYMRTMNMFQWAKYGYADSDMLNNQQAEELARRKQIVQENNNDEELQRKYEAGEISEAEYRTMRTTVINKKMMDEAEAIISRDSDNLSDVMALPDDFRTNGDILEEKIAAQDAPKPVEVEEPVDEEDFVPSVDDQQGRTLDVVVPEENTQSPADPGFVKDVTTINEEDIQDNLTEEDIQYLALKWGLLYKPSEWVKMEELYRKYAASYEISIDREQALKAICKTDLKMNQAIDIGDIKTFKDLQAANDQLRKSSKFTDSQKQEEKQRELDSIGQLVEFVEKEGGVIPQYFDPIETPEDRIDFIINDIKHYTDNLVKNELGLGNLIESYIKKLEENKAQSVEDILRAGSKNFTQEEVTQSESEGFIRFQIEERDEEARKLAEQYVAK